MTQLISMSSLYAPGLAGGAACSRHYLLIARAHEAAISATETYQPTHANTGENRRRYIASIAPASHLW